MAESKYEVIKLNDTSWSIEDDMVRALLFEGTERALLVDTGFGNGNIREVVEGLTGKSVMLVTTHADIGLELLIILAAIKCLRRLICTLQNIPTIMNQPGKMLSYLRSGKGISLIWVQENLRLF